VEQIQSDYALDNFCQAAMEVRQNLGGKPYTDDENFAEGTYVFAWKYPQTTVEHKSPCTIDIAAQRLAIQLPYSGDKDLKVPGEVSREEYVLIREIKWSVAPASSRDDYTEEEQATMFFYD
jgi:hypothetical protein